MAPNTTNPSTSGSQPQVERLQAVNQHLRLALDQVQDGVLLLEPSPLEPPGPRIAYANAAMARMVGKQQASLQKLAVGVLMPEEFLGEFLRGFDRETREGKVWVQRGLLVAENSEELSVEWSLSSTRDQSGKILNFIATCRAVSAPAQLHTGGPVKILSKDGDELPSPESYHGDQVDNVRETARRVAHEFNNALTAISLPLEMAVGRAKGDAQLVERLELAQHSASNAATLAKDFLDCFRSRPPARVRTNLHQLLQRTLRLATISEHVKWELNASADLFDVEVDQEQVERVIFNLVRNACDAMEHQGHLVVLAQNHAGVEGQNWVGISVRDYGPGIPEVHLKHLFHSRFTTKLHGNGCGLPICYQIIKAHGGEILVNTKVNVGTAFTIYLPALPVQETPAPATHVVQLQSAVVAPEVPAKPVKRVKPAGHKQRVLIVDDEEVICLLAGEVCKHLGYAVDTVSEGEKALSLVKAALGSEDEVDGVLMDINLRGSFNGVDTLREMRKLQPDIAVVATSGEHHSDEHYRSFGFDGFLAKPYKMDNLRDVLKGMLG
jgi:two-component system, cell cycle sensor histidine kinase and response regulator CckA